MKKFIRRDPQHRDQVPFLQLLPNLVTLSGMCLGLTSIRFAMDGRYDGAALLLLLAALMDGLDGLLARRLNATSNFGAELDSLSDFLCFGVAPGLLIYRFFLEPSNNFGWIFVLVFAAACCLRLARFNVMRDENEAETSHHFLGVPAPAGAMLGLLPLFVSLAGIVDLRPVPHLVAFWLGFVGVLMISRLRTFSPKAMRIPRALVGLMMFATVVAVGLMFTRIWLLLTALDLIYLALLVHAALQARRPDAG
ncbi:phosphatidylcholine/phosphatidylserine synthase [Rhodovulum sp. MB263]|uniref:CDP-alcohol phosphatidyltransferase family protein n=1 Tax=unclassified Rhodovulum TaxID=2631432 RepID=UPI0009B76BC4|nr:phosphatidylcholine/phosphatidylserine synthase [Rhodovulum sp. MB263]ARC87906.1 CDP-diacylglycerol--serine O-phosphatidyltransferase [Rhodovulum sp. MB263]